MAITGPGSVFPPLRLLRPRLLAGLTAGTLTGCATEPAPPPPPATTMATPVPAPAAPQIVTAPFEEAVRSAAQDLFSNAGLAADQRFDLVIDPLVDGNTGVRSLATGIIEESIRDLVRSSFPQLQLRPFNATSVAALPVVLVGTLTPINLNGQPDGDRDGFRICLALADLKSGRVISKGFSRALAGTIDATPQPFFRDMPMLLRDATVEGYIKTCQGSRAGDPIEPTYIDSVLAAAAIAEAQSAYEARRYRESLALYQAILKNPAGRQARVQAGIYLSNLRLKRRAAAMRAFGELVEMGLASDRLALRFAFKPGATTFAPSEHPYALWLGEIARRSLAKPGCVEVAGHVARSTAGPASERLSLQRAEFVRRKVMEQRRAFGKRSSAKGYGSSQALVGTGLGDDSDALDERIEFLKVGC